MAEFDGLKNKQDLGRFVVEYLEQNPVSMSAVDGLQTAATAGTQQPLPMEGTWVEYGGGYAPPTYRTIPGNGIALNGLVKHAGAVAASSQISYVPITARPGKNHAFSVPGSFAGGFFVGAMRVDVQSDGGIYMVATGELSSIEYLFLDGIVYWPGT